MSNTLTKKRMRIMLISVGILFGAIFLYKIIMGFIIKHAIANQSRVITVSTTRVTETPWQQQLTSVGSLRAIKGVNVTTELAGMVETIYFTPGAYVEAGTLLVQLKATSDIAELHSLQANAELAKITYDRDQAQYKIKGVSKQVVDADAANLKNANAQVEKQAAIVAKKTIRAPFSGRLGINYLNPGQYINPGDSIVSLQTIDPIYVDFKLPQQNLSLLKTGLSVILTSDIFPNKKWFGKISTINSAVDSATRNIAVEATIANPAHDLTPGMFCHVEILIGEPKLYLTVPQSALSFNTYGDIIYTVRYKGKDKKDQPILIAKQVFVKTGETRGEQIAILQGLKKGDTIITSGQLKLKNESLITVNNKVVPSDNPAPDLRNDH